MRASEIDDLFNVMFGDYDVPDSWNQSFHFHDHGRSVTYFTLHQEEGGPCGPYAAIQVSIDACHVNVSELVKRSHPKFEVRHRVAFHLIQSLISFVPYIALDALKDDF